MPALDAATPAVAEPLAAEGRAVRSVIGLAGQSASVDDLLTGRENLELAGLLCHLDKAVYRRRGP